MTYLILNIVLITSIYVVLKGTKRLTIDHAILKLFFVLALLTAVFDSILIAMNFFYYNSEKLIGLYIALAPVEDFFYPILAVILIPSLWNIFRGSEDD